MNELYIIFTNQIAFKDTVLEGLIRIFQNYYVKLNSVSVSGRDLNYSQVSIKTLESE